MEKSSCLNPLEHTCGVVSGNTFNSDSSIILGNLTVLCCVHVHVCAVIYVIPVRSRKMKRKNNLPMDSNQCSNRAAQLL